LNFHTLSGVLKVVRDGKSGLQMTLPHNAPVALNSCDKLVNESIAPLVAVVTKACGGVDVADVSYSAATKKLVVRLKDESVNTILAINGKTFPNELTAAHSSGDIVRGVIVTTNTPSSSSLSSSDNSYDFQSRYFAPWVAIPEDPVTGSAHTVLGPYYSTLLNKTELKARQCSPRGGDLQLKINSNSVEVTGEATVVLKGEVILP